MMTNTEFVKRLLEIPQKYKTRYAKGTFGQYATDTFINGKAKQYPEWYSDSRIATLKSLSDDTRLFDCVGLVKAVIWNFPDTVYTSNGLKDMNDQMIWNASLDKSYDFSKIQVGELLWVKGHVGVYIGDGKAIECTNAWKSNVQITAVSNIGKIAGLNSRHWTGHGKIHVISYNATDGSNSTSKPKVEYNTYPVLLKGSTGQYVKILQGLLLEHGCDPKGIDGKFGPNTLSAVIDFQSKNTDIYGKPLEVDGKVGKLTWGSLYK